VHGAAPDLGRRQTRPRAGGEALEILSARAELRAALPRPRAMLLEHPDPMTNDVAQDAQVLVAHGRSRAGGGVGSARAPETGTAGRGSVMSNKG
jgi:hypothetical protein